MLPVHRLVRNASSCLDDTIVEVPGAKPSTRLAQYYMSWAEYFLSKYEPDANKAYEKLVRAHTVLKDLLSVYYSYLDAPCYETERLEAIIEIIEEIMGYLCEPTSDVYEVYSEEYIELTELPEFCE